MRQRAAGDRRAIRKVGQGNQWCAGIGRNWFPTSLVKINVNTIQTETDQPALRAIPSTAQQDGEPQLEGDCTFRHLADP